MNYGNIIVDMLSAPNYGLAVPPLHRLKLEIAIFNVAYDNIRKKM